MSKKWDYALLSEEAKEHGGPDELRDYYESEGRTEGRVETAIVGTGILLLYLGCKWGYNKGRRYFRDKNFKKKLEAARKRIEGVALKTECMNCRQTLENGELTTTWNDGDNSHVFIKCLNCGSKNILEGCREG